ncbi:oligosaccharide repeat unit polymerase [Yoonia sp.]|uniref:oligosaccharide repeat unit polymerase n=1 Tax=Yoonia sp. TaxID=2212373 RepID=UPI0019E3B7FF|nr:oligosaccharide repeat unit polymerase [Yoonia sp.]MBE0412434.1 oligosaccharide repeat unit polymerase [Yoonia sp.]
MENALIIALGLVCAAVPFALGQRYGLVRLVSPMHLLGWFCLFGFTTKAVVYAMAPQFAFYRRFVDNPWGDLLGALYLALFILAICLGYRLACAPVRQPDNIQAARIIATGIARRGWLFGLAFGVAAATALMILRARGATLDLDLLAGVNSAKQINVGANGVGSTLAGLKTLFIVPKCAFVLLLAHGVAARARLALVQAAALAVLLLGIALISGDRFELVEMLIYALATSLMLGGRISGRAAVWLVGVGAVIVALSVYMTELRLGQGGGFGLLASQLVGSTYFLDLNAAIMITDRMEPDQMMLGQSYFWWLFGWVPRAIWVDKPAVDLGVFFKRDLMGVYTGGGYNVTGPGEAFINFGWGGVGVGLVLGWLYRKGEAAVLAARATLRHGAFLLYPLLFYPFVQATLQSSFSAFIVLAVAQFVMIAAMIAIFVPRYAVKARLYHRGAADAA